MNDGGLGGDGTSHPILGFIRPAPTVRFYPLGIENDETARSEDVHVG